jgi:serine/threonine protein kinase
MKSGDFFKHYYLIDRIGHGGMSVVHLAFDLQTKQFVALKTLFSDLYADSEYRNRFQREVDVYKTLRHPNIISIIDSSIDNNIAYMALEYVKGRSLGTVMDDTRDRMPIHDAVLIIENLTNALFHAHSTGIVHRDVQPNNIIITPDNNLKLLDFGIAHKEDDLIHTQTGTIMGTFVYCSPEQNQGKSVDERSDLYSLGLIFYELLSGRRAIKGTSLMEITEYQLRHTIPPVKQLRFEIPDFINDIVMKLIQKWPEHRYKNTREVIDELIQVKLQSDFSELDMIFGNELQIKFDTASKAFRSMRFDLANKLCEEALEIDKTHAPSHFLRGQIFSRHSELENAHKAYEQALKYDKNNSDIHMEYALNLYRMGEDTETVRECQKILEHDSENKLASGLSTLLSGLVSGKLQPDREFCPAFSNSTPLSISTHLKTRNPFDDNLDLVERVGILNHLLDKLSPDRANLLSTIFPGAGDLYNGVVKRGLKTMLYASSLIIFIYLMLSATIQPTFDVYGFMDTCCNKQIITMAMEEHLHEKVNLFLHSYLNLIMILLSFPAIGLLLYMWIISRERVSHYYHQRHLYGRVRSEIFPGIIEMQLPSTPVSDVGESFFIVENDPLLTVNSKRLVLGTATIIKFSQALAICTYNAIDTAAPEPSPGDMALPVSFISNSLLPTPDSKPESSIFATVAKKYWQYISKG